MASYPIGQLSAPPCFVLWLSATVSATVCSLFFAFAAFILTLVGTTVGAISGGFVGVQNKSGFLHGVGIGSIMGCILSAEIFKACFAFWDSDDFGLGCFTYLIGNTSNCLRVRLLRGRHRPTMHLLQESQADAADMAQNEVYKTLKIPRISSTNKRTADTLWNELSCSICLQDFKAGERACILPECHHIFHLFCIRTWFIGHSSCPLCRTRLSRKWRAMVCNIRKET